MSFTENLKDRCYAFLIHLSLSVVVALIASAIVFGLWYPAPLHTAIGVTEIFLMLLAVDITIGPVITFIIYRRDKPSLKFDLTVIALFQLAALSYGMNTVYVGRPAFVVFNVDMFELTRAIDIDEKSLQKALDEQNTAAEITWSPHWVGAIAAKDSKRRQEILFSSVQGGADWPQLPELYVPLEQVKTQMLQRAKDWRALQQHYADQPELVQFANQYPQDKKWLPLRGKAKDMIVVIDGTSAEVLGIVNLNPWF